MPDPNGTEAMFSDEDGKSAAPPPLGDPEVVTTVDPVDPDEAPPPATEDGAPYIERDRQDVEGEGGEGGDPR